MMVLGAGNQLTLVAGLSDEWNLLMGAQFLNSDTIVSKLLNLDTIMTKCRIGVNLWYIFLFCIFILFLSLSLLAVGSRFELVRSQSCDIPSRGTNLSMM